MITHKEALEAAYTLYNYCGERFKGMVAIKCEECTFKLVSKNKSKKPMCVLPYFIGFCDEETANLTHVAVHEKFEYLTGFGKKKK